MFALIYDEHNLARTEKPVISVHKSRETAEKALAKRQKELGRKVTDCNTRIVWVHGAVKAGGRVSIRDFSTWGPGEKIPEGEVYPDSD